MNNTAIGMYSWLTDLIKSTSLAHRGVWRRDTHTYPRPKILHFQIISGQIAPPLRLVPPLQNPGSF